MCEEKTKPNNELPWEEDEADTQVNRPDPYALEESTRMLREQLNRLEASMRHRRAVVRA